MDPEKDQSDFVRDIHVPLLIGPYRGSVLFEEFTDTARCLDPASVVPAKSAASAKEDVGIRANLKVETGHTPLLAERGSEPEGRLRIPRPCWNVGVF
jgi:hypothetical protein